MQTHRTSKITNAPDKKGAATIFCLNGGHKPGAGTRKNNKQNMSPIFKELTLCLASNRKMSIRESRRYSRRFDLDRDHRCLLDEIRINTLRTPTDEDEIRRYPVWCLTRYRDEKTLLFLEKLLLKSFQMP